jgi:hypothetical protein
MLMPLKAHGTIQTLGIATIHELQNFNAYVPE